MSSGVLYMVATPIGNLSDMSARAVETLKSVDIVAAEDTRHSRILFNHYAIHPRSVVSYHAHNIESRTRELIAELQRGKNVALVTDAGSPGISDPGAVLVRDAVAEGVTICPMPGASAVMLALMASGFPTHRFIYEGFLPRKKGRKTMFESWVGEERSIVFFESPHRIVKTLREIQAITGSRRVCVAREMTKLHEEFLRGEAGEVADELEKRSAVKGEITAVLAPY
jgi:16S rRNA (cytidine1402-2'-O)-methyltransferase